MKLLVLTQSKMKIYRLKDIHGVKKTVQIEFLIDRIFLCIKMAHGDSAIVLGLKPDAGRREIRFEL